MAGLSRIAFALIALVVSSPAFARDQHPTAELFAGYSFQTVRIPGSVTFAFPGLTPRYAEPRREHSNGWAFSVNRNLSRHIGVKADAAGAYGAQLVDECLFILDQGAMSSISCIRRRDVSRYQFLFGPQFSLRTGRVTQFAHSLAGFQHRRVEGFDPETGFALGFGGGVDVKIRDRLAIRAFQADYLPAKEGPFWRHPVRLGAGIVFHFGGH
jgi:hypothetical protein